MNIYTINIVEEKQKDIFEKYGVELDGFIIMNIFIEAFSNNINSRNKSFDELIREHICIINKTNLENKIEVSREIIKKNKIW